SDMKFGMDAGLDHAIALLERRPPDLMAPQELVEGVFQRLAIERAGAMDGDRFIVERHRGRERRVQPDVALLGRQARRMARGPRLHAAFWGTARRGIAAQQLVEQALLLFRQTRVRDHAAALSKDTGSDSSPRSPRFCRHCSGPESRVTPGKRRSSVEK